MSDLEISELRRLAEAATPVAWNRCGVGDDEEWIGTDDAAIEAIGRRGGIICEPPLGWDHSMRDWPANAAYIVAAQPSVILTLLARLEQLEAIARLARDGLPRPPTRLARRHGRRHGGPLWLAHARQARLCLIDAGFARHKPGRKLWRGRMHPARDRCDPRPPDAERNAKIHRDRGAGAYGGSRDGKAAERPEEKCA